MTVFLTNQLSFINKCFTNTLAKGKIRKVIPQVRNHKYLEKYNLENATIASSKTAKIRSVLKISFNSN